MYNVWNKCNLLRLWLEVKAKLSHYRSGWPLGNQEIKIPKLSKKSAQEGGKFVSPRYRPPLLPGGTPGTYSCSRLNRTEGLLATRTIKSMNTPNDSIGNRTCELPACSAVPQLTAPPNTSWLSTKCATIYIYIYIYMCVCVCVCVCVCACYLIISYFFVGNLLLISLRRHRKRPALWWWKVEAIRQRQQVAELRVLVFFSE